MLLCSPAVVVIFCNDSRPSHITADSSRRLVEGSGRLKRNRSPEMAAEPGAMAHRLGLVADTREKLAVAGIAELNANHRVLEDHRRARAVRLLVARYRRTVRAVDRGEQRVIVVQQLCMERGERPGICLDVARATGAAVGAEAGKEAVGRTGIEIVRRRALQHAELIETQRSPRPGCCASAGTLTLTPARPTSSASGR